MSTVIGNALGFLSPHLKNRKMEENTFLGCVTLRAFEMKGADERVKERRRERKRGRKSQKRFWHLGGASKAIAIESTQ